MAETGFLLPDPDDPDNAPFWAGTARGELRIQRCDACGRRRMPPRPMCPSCRSLQQSWQKMSGRGTIWSFVVPHPPLLPAYAEIAPYNVVIVALDEEPTIRLVGNVIAGPDGTLGDVDPHSIEIGEAVQVVYREVGDVTLPQWVRA